MNPTNKQILDQWRS